MPPSTDSSTLELLPVLERELRAMARAGTTATYAALARRLELGPPHRIHQTTVLLEALMDQQAGRGEAQLASLIVSRARQGLPAPGFFLKLQALGLHDGPAEGSGARRRHAEELARVYAAAGATAAAEAAQAAAHRARG